jgi:hypothetical protein
MKNLRTKLAAVVITAAAFTAAPIAAFADGYPPASVVSGPATVTAGGTATFTFGGFDPNEQVTFTLTGENAAGATLAVVKAAVNSKSITKTASAQGTASVTVTLPANASGTYTLTADSASTDPASTTFTVAGSGGSGLPATGIDAASMTGVWIGGGALLAAGIAVTSVAVIRRRQAEQA